MKDKEKGMEEEKEREREKERDKEDARSVCSINTTNTLNVNNLPFFFHLLSFNFGILFVRIIFRPPT